MKPERAKPIEPSREPGRIGEIPSKDGQSDARRSLSETSISKENLPLRVWLLRAGAIFAGWTVLGVLWATNRSLYRLDIGQPADLGENLRNVLADYWLWALLTPAIFYLAHRFPFNRRTWLRSGIVHFGGYVVLSILHEILAMLLQIPSYVPAGFHGSLLKLRVVESLNEDFWMYWPIVVVWGLVEYYQRYRERDLRASQLSERLARAELQALRNQLHPHFLFNALNSIAALIHEDVEAADDTLADLGHLLRAYLSGGDEQEISLEREVELLSTYVRIQQRRFEDRLRWMVELPEKLKSAVVPALLLQPLVENSILHGIASRPGPGRVQVRAMEEGGHLRLEVRDDGRGLPSNYKDGVGIANTRARLVQLHGNRQSFQVESNPSLGTRVVITLPLRFTGAVEGKQSDEDSDTNRGRRTSSAPEDSVAAISRD